MEIHLEIVGAPALPGSPGLAPAAASQGSAAPSDRNPLQHETIGSAKYTTPP